MNNCTTCKYVNFELMEKTYYCRRNPPTVFLVPQPGGQIGKVSTFPPVSRLIVCGEHRMKLAGVVMENADNSNT